MAIERYIRVLHRNGTMRMCVCCVYYMDRYRYRYIDRYKYRYRHRYRDFKELAYIIVKTGNSKIYQLGCQNRDTE